MGRSPVPKQPRLAEKLLTIRQALGLSQNELLRHLGLAEELVRSNISSYELGERTPPVHVLLRYARAAGVCLDVIVDPEMDLPEILPNTPKHQGVIKTSAS